MRRLDKVLLLAFALALILAALSYQWINSRLLAARLPFAEPGELQLVETDLTQYSVRREHATLIIRASSSTGPLTIILDANAPYTQQVLNTLREPGEITIWGQEVQLVDGSRALDIWQVEKLDRTVVSIEQSAAWRRFAIENYANTTGLAPTFVVLLVMLVVMGPYLGRRAWDAVLSHAAFRGQRGAQAHVRPARARRRD